MVKAWHILPVVGTAILAMTCGAQPDEVTHRRPSWAAGFIDSCPASEIDTTGWKTIQSRSVSFKVPLEYVDDPGGFFCGEGVHLEHGERTIGFCASCAPYVGNEQWLRCTEMVGGHTAYIVASRNTVFEGKYFAGASWINGPSRMVLGGWSPDVQGQQIVLAVIRTVQFKVTLDDVPVEWSPPPVDTTRPTPTFVDACPAPRIDTSRWNRFDIGSISISVPPEYVEAIGIPIDIEPDEEDRVSRTFVFGRSRVGITVDPGHSFGLTVGMNDSGCREAIGEHQAHIVSGRGPGDTYFVSASWNDSPLNVFVGGSSTSMLEQRRLLAVVRTVRFSKQAE
ncbi:MAG TPA: hypothetical protein VEC56_01255 [Candidatus Krumholzibacteria bacterium]|nr:hypothetical protein [Candidatus Krumholzibacteria bacterium]